MARSARIKSQGEYRLTSFWPAESTPCTGSGLCSWDFQTNDKGWYTYNGKLVIATATTYLANQGWYVGEGVSLHKYWEEITININGIDYQAIILDSCGACMKRKIIDLFVVDGWASITTQITVK